MWIPEGGGGSDEDAIHDNVAGEIAAVTEKATPGITDVLLIEDASDSNNKKRVQVGNLPSGTATASLAIVYLSSDQSIASGSDVSLSWDAESEDTDGFHEGVTNPTRLTAPTDGVYEANVTVTINNATGDIRVGWKKDGVNAFLGHQRLHGAGSAAASTVVQASTGPVRLASGDYLEASVRHTTGSARNALGGTLYTDFQVTHATIHLIGT